MSLVDPEKKGQADAVEPASSGDNYDVAIAEGDQGHLHRNLKGRHMQMIAM